MKKRRPTKLVAVITAVLTVAASLHILAYAQTEYIVDDDDRVIVIEHFNKSVNAIKTQRPYMKMESHISLTDATVGSKNTGESLDANGKKYLAWILDACLAPDSGIAQTLFNTVNGVPRLPKETEFVYGEKRDNRLPKAGERYVSSLRATDDFILKTQSYGGTLLHPENEVTVTRIEFPSVKLEDSENSPINRLFDLPSPVLNPVIVGSDPGAYDKDGRFSDIALQEFTFENAYAEASFDNDGNVAELTESIDYSFEISFYDLIRILSAVSGIDWVGIAIVGIANPILGSMGKEDMEAKDVLGLYTVYVTYTSYVKMTSFNWADRYFGDIDSSLTVDAADARAILRHAVGLDVITNQLSQVYADIDFDGKITPADARLALRTAVGLEEAITSPPEGKTISIIYIDDIVEPAEPDEPGEITVDTDPEISEDRKDDFSSELSGFTGSVLDIINMIKDDKNITADGIKQIVDELHKILGNEK